MLDESSTTETTSATPAGSAPRVTTALAPVRVEDWTLFASEGAHWVRDLDLAERAELKNPRDIRAHIQKAAKDGLLTIVAGGDDGPTAGPVVRAERVMVTIGSGAAREVTEYYLNQEAALLLVTRLRTPKAIEITKAIVRVFLAVARGQIKTPRRQAARGALESDDVKRAELVLKIVGRMSPAVTAGARDAMLASAVSMLTGEPAPALSAAAVRPGRWRRPAEIAMELGVSLDAVGKAITALGYRDRPEHREDVMSPKRGAEGEVLCHRWDEEVFAALKHHFSEEGRREREEKRAEGRVRVADGARQVLEAINRSA